MTELGNRASDVSAMELEAVDLSAKVLHLRRPKQRRFGDLPLTTRLATAIEEYLQRGRPDCHSPWLFVIHRAPLGKRLTPMGICNIVNRRARQAGLADRVRGSHVLRHSRATLWINQGASIKEIADLLGHRSIDTAGIYAKVDLASLKAVALPWPREREVL
jgi:site-specific recombinase XerD